MDFFFGLMQTIGVHTILGLSAYVVLQTGQVTVAQAGFFAVGAYAASMLTTLAGWPIVPAILLGGVAAALVAGISGFPALRVKGLMLVVATMALSEIIRLFFFIFNYQVAKGDVKLGPVGAEGFKQIRYFPENGWTVLDVLLFIWAFVALIMGFLWWLDRSRAGSVLRAVGEDELAAQSVGVNLVAVKVSAFALGGLIAGIGGGLYAHYTTHIEHSNFSILLATFALAYPILGGLSNVFGTLLAVLFVQGFLIYWLPDLIVKYAHWVGQWSGRNFGIPLEFEWVGRNISDIRNLLFGALIILAMNVRPRGLIDERTTAILARLIPWRRRGG